ncbi:MAG TPA: radical SAM protein [Dongiaceae bacterium]|jgi:hypothetical protein|nr:radical SAM protein [Dongiaceae bacterium]
MTSPYMTKAELAAIKPEILANPAESLQRARERVERAGQWLPGQAMGRRFPVGCVALEITQRCNLDCTLCYLSELSEAVRDLPLAEIFRRIETIHRMYGPMTEIQITGGDPTLRKEEELIAIVARVRALGMRPSLFTNGIRASRALLTKLRDAGLVDVAFHVDTTQKRKGYASERDLNALREEYIRRARGLHLSILFNTTVHAGNFHEMPELVRFFVTQAADVRLASFQLAADTGRGIERHRPALITAETMAAQIEQGTGAMLNFDVPLIGHKKCNRYAMALVTGGRVHDLFDRPDFVRRYLDRSAGLNFDRTRPWRACATLAGWAVRNPWIWPGGLSWLARKAWRMKRDLWRGRGRIHKLSFFIHNFMDACRLERDRIESCVFMAATADGPLSMCLHNARRDEFITAPFSIDGEAWMPLGAPGEDAKARVPAKGRMRRTEQAAL